jgi:PAS domain S-box-containing protein
MAAIPLAERLYEDAACGLVLTATDGTIRRVNATACRWLGYAAVELVDRVRFQDLLTVGARVFHQTHVQPLLLQQGSVAEVQVDVRHRDQGRIPMLINIVRQRHDDAVFDEWALFVATDRQSYERELRIARATAESALDARRDAETKLQGLNQQLSLADRRKDEFLATLSHELRNPLAPMRSALEVLKLRLAGDAGYERMLAVFDRQMHHMTHLVDDLMDVSRITQGRMELRRAPVDLAGIVRAAADDVRGMMAAASHRFTVTLPAPGVIVDADATRLTQVIANLLTNAAKYTPDGGQVSLRADAVDGQALITVRDNGIGIPQQALDSIFTMFSQLTSALDRSNGGLGIGLALVRGIVELHGGTISAASAGPGLGSEFAVRLPLAAGADRAQGEAPPPMPPPGALRVLVVDDNVDAADTLAMALELLGYEAKAAYTAGAGQALAAGFAPQVALLDIGLPDMNGYELAGRLRAGPAGESMFLIAATGWGQDADRQRAIDAGFDRHLTKPVDFDKLREMLAGHQR